MTKIFDIQMRLISARNIKALRFVVIGFFVCIMMGTSVRGQQPDNRSPTQKYFTDVDLINQENQKMRLYSDLLKGKIVIINSFFAGDQGSSLSMNRNLKKVQEALRERVGKNVIIFSISVDPTTDTPARLKEYARKLGTGPGWYFLTGDKENVDLALYKLGYKSQDHSNIIFIGNEPTGLWKKVWGLSPSNELMKIVEEVINDHGCSPDTICANIISHPKAN